MRFVNYRRFSLAIILVGAELDMPRLTFVQFQKVENHQKLVRHALSNACNLLCPQHNLYVRMVTILHSELPYDAQ